MKSMLIVVLVTLLVPAVHASAQAALLRESGKWLLRISRDWAAFKALDELVAVAEASGSVGRMQQGQVPLDGSLAAFQVAFESPFSSVPTVAAELRDRNGSRIPGRVEVNKDRAGFWAMIPKDARSRTVGGSLDWIAFEGSLEVSPAMVARSGGVMEERGHSVGSVLSLGNGSVVVRKLPPADVTYGHEATFAFDLNLPSTRTYVLCLTADKDDIAVAQDRDNQAILAGGEGWYAAGNDCRSVRGNERNVQRGTSLVTAHGELAVPLSGSVGRWDLSLRADENGDGRAESLIGRTTIRHRVTW